MPQAYNYAGKTVCLSADFNSSKEGAVDGKIYVVNTAGVDTTAITVTVTVPTGLTLVGGSADASAGTFNDGLLEWKIPDPGVLVGGTESLNLCFTVDADTAEALVVDYVVAVDSGLEAITSDNSGSSILCGIPCADVQPCITITDYLAFGDNVIVVSGSGTAADPLLFNVSGGSSFPSADLGNLMTASINDNGYFLDAQTINDALVALTPAPVLGSF
jgi:hypothetical protein